MNSRLSPNPRWTLMCDRRSHSRKEGDLVDYVLHRYPATATYLTIIAIVFLLLLIATVTGRAH